LFSKVTSLVFERMLIHSVTLDVKITQSLINKETLVSLNFLSHFFFNLHFLYVLAIGENRRITLTNNRRTIGAALTVTTDLDLLNIPI
jgi:hypothetical protein